MSRVTKRALALGAAAALIVPVIAATPALASPPSPTDEAPIKVFSGAKTGLEFPGGIAYDADGNLYISNAGLNYADPTAIKPASVTVYAPGSKPGDTKPIKTLKGSKTGLSVSSGIAFDSEGRMYVANVGLDTSDPNNPSFDPSITVYAADWKSGNTKPIKTLKGAKTGLLTPMGIAFDSKDRMYITDLGLDPATPDTTTPKVLQFAADWKSGNTKPAKVLTGADTTLNGPVGIAFDSKDRMLVSDAALMPLPGATSNIAVFAKDWAKGNTAPIRSIEGPETTLVMPFGLAIAADGSIIASDLLMNSIQFFAADANGDVAPIKTLSGPLTQLDAPFGIGLSPAGLLAVANSGIALGGGVPSVTVYAGPPQAPGAPRAVKAEVKGVSMVFTWKAPKATEGAAPVTSYGVVCVDVKTKKPVQTVVSAKKTKATLTGVEGATYRCAVVAINEAGGTPSDRVKLTLGGKV